MALTKVRVAGLNLADDTATVTLEDTSSHSANTGPAISFKSKDSGGTTREVAKVIGESHSGANEGNLALQTRNGGTLETKWKVFKNGNLLPSSTDYGIYLGATAAGDANLLNDYEEGTWTPAIVGPSNTPTYYNQVGRYTKIGRSVTIQCFLQTNVSPTYSNANTQFKISGVPFNLLAIGYTGGQGTVNSQSLGFTSGDNDQGSSGTHLTVGINASEQLIFHNTGSGQTRGSVENSGTTSGFILECTLTYFTDA